MDDEEPRLRIGELSRRVDVEPALLRAWEKRYGLLAPQRSEGNFRLYSLGDVARVRAMKLHLSRGLAAAEAARLALAGGDRQDSSPTSGSDHRATADELYSALVQLDERKASHVLDRAFALNSLDEALGEIILPCMRKIGDRWQQGDVNVAEEHFASSLVRATLLSLSQGWSSGGGPKAVLACLPGEQHDIGLICFGLVLWRNGWRIIYVGQDTPLPELQRVVVTVHPDLVVVAALAPDLFRGAEEDLRSLAAAAPLAVAGADSSTAARADAVLLDADAVAAAHMVAAMTLPSGSS